MSFVKEKLNSLILKSKFKASAARTACQDKIKELHNDQRGISTFLEVVIIIGIVAIIAVAIYFIGRLINDRAEGVGEELQSLDSKWK